MPLRGRIRTDVKNPSPGVCRMLQIPDSCVFPPALLHSDYPASHRRTLENGEHGSGDKEGNRARATREGDDCQEQKQTAAWCGGYADRRPLDSPQMLIHPGAHGTMRDMCLLKRLTVAFSLFPCWQQLESSRINHSLGCVASVAPGLANCAAWHD